jgi:hypothetical protein
VIHSFLHGPLFYEYNDVKDTSDHMAKGTGKESYDAETIAALPYKMDVYIILHFL